jgi:hypothetical protein
VRKKFDFHKFVKSRIASTAETRQRLRDYIGTAEDKQLKAFYADRRWHGGRYPLILLF